MRLSGWALTGWIAVALLAASAAVLAGAGVGEEGVRAWIRLTARTSLALFLVVFVARPLRQLWRVPATAWMLRNRRHLGVGFAVSHGLHGAGLLWFGFGFPAAFQAQVDSVTLLAGAVGFAFVAALAATSSDGAVKALGVRRWRLLHRTGLWVLFAIFLATTGGAAAGGSVLHRFTTAALLAALGLRVAAWAVRRRPRAAAAA